MDACVRRHGFRPEANLAVACTPTHSESSVHDQTAIEGRARFREKVAVVEGLCDGNVGVDRPLWIAGRGARGSVGVDLLDAPRRIDAVVFAINPGLMLRCLHAGHSLRSNGGTVWCSGWKIESAPWAKPSIAFRRVERDRTAHTEQDLVEIVLVLGVAIAGVV